MDTVLQTFENDKINMKLNALKKMLFNFNAYKISPSKCRKS